MSADPMTDGYKRFYAELDAQTPPNALAEWSQVSIDHYLDALSEHTEGMSYPERFQWLTLELGVPSEAEDERIVQRHRGEAWALIQLWQAEQIRLDDYAKRSREALWATPYDELMAKTREKA